MAKNNNKWFKKVSPENNAKKSKFFKSNRHGFEQLEPRLMLEGINFVHPGIVNTAADYDRMVDKVAILAEPWTAGFNALTSSSYSQLGATPRPAVTITRAGGGSNFNQMVGDIYRTHQSALRWKVSGDTRYADQAVTFLNAWSSTMTELTGNSDRFLASGLYGYTWAATADLMSSYSGWAAADVTAFQNYLLNIYYPMQHDFLTGHNGAYDTNYWANWDLANIEGMMAVGVFTDRHDIYQEAMSYLYNGNGNGTLDNVVYYLHPGNLAQWQESGRDQGHTLLGMQLFGNIAQMAWNQGDDLFSYNNNQFLAAAEYIAKYNSFNDVPFTSYSWISGSPGVWYSFDTQTTVGWGSRGNRTVGYELIYNHYVNLMGYDAPYSEARILGLGPEGSGGNGDSLGFGTLTFALDPIATGQTPKSLTAVEKGTGNIELDWFGAPYTTSYNIYRSTSVDGTYSQIASGITDLLTYTDYNLPAGTYYYKVTGIASSGETGSSNIVYATSTNIIQTQLLFDESSGITTVDATGNGHTGTLLNGALFAAGKTGNAISLDGTDDYVSLPANIVEDYNDFTVSSWVYLDSASTFARVFDFGDTNNRWMMLSVKNWSGVPEFNTGTVYNCNVQSVTGNSPLPLNQWVHLAVTLSDKVGKLYVNGVLVGANANMEFSPLQIGATANNWLGRSQWSADAYLDGKIDDFRIYRGALKTADIYNLATGNGAPAVPAAPASLSATAVVGNKINLSWSSVSGATSYSVLRATTSGGPYTTIASMVSGTTYSNSNCTADTTYYYVVTAANLGGDGAYSPQAFAVALPPMPGAPTYLTTASVSATSAFLSWTGGSDAYTYQIKRATVSGGPYTTVATGVTETSYTDPGLTTNTTYYYVVIAVNTAGESANSNESFLTPTDLLLQLKLDDAAGTMADDVSVTNRPGTLVNGPIWTTTGKINGAVDLDGTDDYVSLPTGIVNGLTTCTITAWVYIDALSNQMRVFDFGTGTNVNMFLTPSNGSTVRFAITTGSWGSEQAITGTSALPTGVWTHVAVTLNGSVGTLYVNGVQVGQNTSMTLTPSSLGITTNNYIGKSQYSDPYLNGKIDDFRIYAHAFTTSEVYNLARTTRPATPTGLTAALVNTNEANLSWNAVAGATGYSVLHATAVSGPYTTLATHVTSTTYHDTSLTINPATGTTHYYAIAAENAGGDSPYSLKATVSLMPPMPDTPTSLVTVPSESGSITLSWTAAANAGSYTIRRSASSAGPYSAIATGVTTTSYTNYGLTNGTTYYYVVATVNATGTSDDSDSVAATATDLRLYLKLNESFGTSASDISGNGFNGTLVNGPTWTSGKIFNALNMNGSSQYVNLPTGVVNGLTDFTISTWVYMASNPAWARIFDFGTGTNNYMFLSANPGNSGTLRFAITNGSGEQQINGGSISLNTWTQVAVTMVGGVGTLYINGLAVGTNTGMTLNPSSLGATTNNYIGKSQFNDPYINGKIDDFRIYNRALTATEVNTLATTNAPSTPTGLTATNSDASISLSWNAVATATSYNVKRSLTSGGPYTTVAGGITTNSYTDTGLANGTRYYYIVTSVNVTSESLNSSQVYATPNAAPTDISLSNATIAENMPIGTEVGVFSTNDPGLPAAPFTYTLVSGTGSTDNGSFTINANGKLLSATVFNFETKSSYSIRVQSTDQGGLWYEETFTISITNVPETYTWDGGSAVDSNWSTPENWIGDIAPIAGDSLVFPAGAVRLDIINDYPTGTAFGSINVSGNRYKITNGGNTTPASIQVQPNMQLEADKIVTGALTIGAGAVVTITPISGGPLAANSTLTPLTTSALRQNVSISNSQPTVASTNTTPPTSPATATSPVEPLATSTVFVAPVSAVSEVVPVRASTSSLSNTAFNTLDAETSLPARIISSSTPAKLFNSAFNRIPAQLPAATHNLIALHGILETRMGNPLAERPINNITKTSTLTSSQDGLSLHRGKSEKNAHLPTINNRRTLFEALQAIVDKADKEIAFDTAHNLCGPKHIQQLEKAIDEVLAKKNECFKVML